LAAKRKGHCISHKRRKKPASTDGSADADLISPWKLPLLAWPAAAARKRASECMTRRSRSPWKKGEFRELCLSLAGSFTSHFVMNPTWLGIVLCLALANGHEKKKVLSFGGNGMIGSEVSEEIDSD